MSLRNVASTPTVIPPPAPPQVCRALIVMVSNAPELHGYAVRTLYRNLQAYQDVAERSLLITSLWCIGEFGEMLVSRGGAY